METISLFLHNSLILQLALAMLLGMLVGAERSHAGKVAGLRTYGLVSLGACLFVIASRAVISQIPGITGSDVMHVVAGVITGIGFLGAGAIIMREQTLTGVTTAAGIWVSAGIGVTVGLGLYAMAIATTVLTLLAFTLFWSIEHHVVGVDEKGKGDK
jgi:putative Mg2+ transporter-C (MgtC) family protein